VIGYLSFAAVVGIA